MNIIEGFVCSGRLGFGDEPREEILFGPHVKNGVESYENLRSNGLKVYDSLLEACSGARELRDSVEFEGVRVGKLKMRVAESDEELCRLMRGRRFVVIRSEQYSLGGTPSLSFLGPGIDGSCGGGLGVDWNKAGFTGFDHIFYAIQLARKIREETKDPIQIGMFNLNFEY